MSNVIIIGGGASGLIAGIIAKRRGNNVTIIEKNEKIGKKIYITGKGRCNLTNNCLVDEFLDNVVTNKKFMYGAINTFSPSKTMDFFEDLGLKLKTERGNRVFPISEKASDVTKYLQKELDNLNVSIKLNEKVVGIFVKENKIFGVKTDKNTYFCDKIILCTGGASYPLTGSTGDGYFLSEKLGHTVTKIYPSLCGFNLKEDFYKELQGLSLKNVTLSVFHNDKRLFSEFGEMLFTHFGISGPIVLTLSALINKIRMSELHFSLDLKPALNNEVLDKRIQREISDNKLKNISNCVRSLVPQALVNVILKKAKIKPTKVCSDITKEERQSLINTLKDFRFSPLSLRSLDEAIVTSGGINIKEINPKTMESKIISGLFFAGEVIDVDCLTGGFNLQTAFSTGYVAGLNV